MAFARLANALLLSQLSLLLLLCASTLVSADATLAHYPPAEAPPPPPPPPPPKPPAHPPVKPPTTPPPSHPPVKPPAHPPVKPPAHPPVKPPTTPPPSHPPVKPPAHPPVKPPAHPPVKPPAYPPVKPPTTPPSSHPPVKPPAYPPVKPPTYPPLRKLVAVQGVVYCKSCKYRGVDTLVGASPLSGAVVKLQCNDAKQSLVEQTKTDKNGYFFFMPPKLRTLTAHKCKVFLVSSPLPKCGVPTNLHGGATGATLIPAVKPPVKIKKQPFVLFNVGPLAFEPHKKLPCHY
ncbi:non-classical arabinogalactan protein 31-like [Sesamum indicum]|uniref:Non-classical arabinogalactan protein 31-like n=1 Tax=Sesamum indicum TaxID=4182 RepID=A0A6I9TN42_SESIN|nr:non-classical arabinogalactan protein 31-like [Sesamum indicum]